MKQVTSFIAFALALGLATSAWAEKLKFAYSDVESELYQLGNGSQMANPPGATIELMNMVAKELDLEFEYVRLPVKRTLESLQAGEVVGAFMYSFKEDRLQYGQFPMKAGKDDGAFRVTMLSYVFYKPTGSAFNWDGKVVSGLDAGIIGFNSNYSVGAELNKMGLKTEEAKTTEQNFKKLAAGRIAAYAMQDHTGDLYIAENKVTGVEKVATPFESKPYYLMLSKQFVQKDPALAEKVWAKLAKIREEKLKALLKKYTP